MESPWVFRYPKFARYNFRVYNKFIFSAYNEFVIEIITN